MSEGSPPQSGVSGERQSASVFRERSLQARLTGLLAGGLVVLLGLGSLVWYYTSVLAAQARAREAARISSLSRAQGELPLPPLTRTELRAPENGPAPPLESALPETTPASPQESPVRPGVVPPDPLATPTPKTAAQVEQERVLSGAVFARESHTPQGGDASPTLAADTAALTGPAAVSAATHSSAPWATNPTLAPTVPAQRLPTQRLLLPRGTFIDCTLESAIDSSLPGLTSCVTATDTFGADGKVVLLERGTRLTGETRGQVAQGMARVFVLWTLARTPTGVVLPLDSPGADALGRAGLPGQVDRHFWERFGAAVLLSMLQGGVQAAVQSGNGGGTVIYNPGTTEGVLTESLKGTLDIPPTVKIANGERIQVMVARDLDFRPVYEVRSRQPPPR